MKYFNTLTEANKERDKYWDSNNKITPSFRANELAGEVGEACNIVKKLERQRLGIKGSTASKKELGKELADIVICANLLALEYELNLDNEIVSKFNLTSDKYNFPVKLNTHI